MLVFVRADAESRFTIVRCCLASLHAVVGCLFLMRREATRWSRWQEMAWCLPSFVLGGFAFTCSAPTNIWPWYANALFVIGTIFAVLSLICLGGNFAIFPTLRGITKHGPYQLVRHPVYLGEYVMVCACCLAYPSVTTISLTAAMIPLLAVRILVEERLLSQSERYTDYQQLVQWRLLPLIW